MAKAGVKDLHGYIAKARDCTCICVCVCLVGCMRSGHKIGGGGKGCFSNHGCTWIQVEFGKIIISMR